MNRKATASTNDVVITPALATRRQRTRDGVAVHRAVAQLVSDTTGATVADGCNACVEVALDLCEADTCGISVEEQAPDGQSIFRWVALAGAMSRYLHGTTPECSRPAASRWTQAHQFLCSGRSWPIPT